MEIEIKGKKYEVKELPYIEAVNLDPEDRSGMIRTLFKSCLGMSDEEINSLSIKEGREAEAAVVEINGLEQDFQKPVEKKE